MRLKKDLHDLRTRIRPPPPPPHPTQATNACDPSNWGFARPKLPFTTFLIAIPCGLLFEEAITGLSSLASIAGLPFRTWPRFSDRPVPVDSSSFAKTNEREQSKVKLKLYHEYNEKYLK